MKNCKITESTTYCTPIYKIAKILSQGCQKINTMLSRPCLPKGNLLSLSKSTIIDMKFLNLHWLIIVITLLLGGSSYANTDVVTIDFQRENVYIKKGNQDLYYVTYSGDQTYFDITGYPAIPYFSLSHIVPQGRKIKSVKAYGDSIVLKHGIKLQEIQEATVIGSKPTSEVKAFTIDSTITVENCKYVASSNIEDVTIAHIAYTPFKYNPISETLYFIEDLTIEIVFEEEFNQNSQQTVMQKWEPTESLRSENLLNLYSKKFDDIVNQFPVDYIIVTVDSLKSAFQPLAKWKTTK